MKCPRCALINPDSTIRCDCGYDFSSKRMEESYLHERGLDNFASRTARLIAYIIDLLIVMVPLYVLALTGETVSIISVASITVWLITNVMQIVLLSIKGQTIGKIILKIKIIKIKTGLNGGFSTNVLLRLVVNNLLAIFIVYPLVDILFIFRKDRRCIHDLIAGTMVVRS